MSSEPESKNSFNEDMHTNSSSTSSLVQGSENRSKQVYFHGGIGGAGNYRKVSKVNDLDIAIPHSSRRSVHRSHLSRFFSSGIGGAGNMHTRAQEAALTQEEELARAKVRTSHGPMRWFVGIGGVGNKRTRRQDGLDNDNTRNPRNTNTSEFSTQALPYGAAEIMRRKLLRGRASER
ncbi:MAG: hypothetical protein Q9191_005211 [Dirinaria sp. TL-2023a]